MALVLTSAVTMPRTRWDDVAVLLLEHVHNLRREGREDLVESLLLDLLPPMLPAVSPHVRRLIEEQQPVEYCRAVAG